MRNPLDSYGPAPEEDEPSFGPPFDDRMPRLRWFQLAATTALFVMFIAQAIQIQDVNRKIALLYERLKVDQERMMDTTPALEAQQRTILHRLDILESTLREIEIERGASSGSSGGAAALQPPPPPSP
ncbi:MAG: hypothetical protein ACK41W_09290 [Cyanobacteriota bacterium]|jgi:hypothetical protein